MVNNKQGTDLSEIHLPAEALNSIRSRRIGRRSRRGRAMVVILLLAVIALSPVSPMLIVLVPLALLLLAFHGRGYLTLALAVTILVLVFQGTGDGYSRIVDQHVDTPCGSPYVSDGALDRVGVCHVQLQRDDPRRNVLRRSELRGLIRHSATRKDVVPSAGQLRGRQFSEATAAPGNQNARHCRPLAIAEIV